jgi:hypothetical protein
MSVQGRILFLTTSLVVLGVGIAHAQQPSGDDLILADFPPNVQAEYSPQPVCDKAGVCGLFWGDNHNAPDNEFDILAATLSQQGQLLESPRVLATLDVATGPIAVGLDRGFAVLWDAPASDGHIFPSLQYYDESLTPQGKAISLPFVKSGEISDPKAYDGFASIVRIPSGFAIYGSAVDDPTLADGIFVYFIDRNGVTTHPRQRLNNKTSVELATTSFNGMTLQPNGDLVAVYWGGDSNSTNVYMRRLSAGGQLLGPERVVNTEHHAGQGLPAVAVSRDSSFLVVWQSTPVPGTTSDILARRFSARGQPLGKPFQVNNVHQLDQRRPAIAADAQGNYCVVWQSFIPPYNWDVKGRLFRSNGTPVADEVRLNQVRQFEQELPHVTFSPAGTILAGWESGSLRQRGNEEFVPVARVFSGVPGPAFPDAPLRVP